MAPLPLVAEMQIPQNRKVGICRFLHLQEENIRFVLLALFLFIYLAFGALLFQHMEHELETKIRNEFFHAYRNFIHNFTTLSPSTYGAVVDDETLYYSLIANTCNFRVLNNSGAAQDSVISTWPEPLVTIEALHQLLFAYGNATQAGVLWKRTHWDFVGSFHFAWTIVSTIGKDSENKCIKK